MLEADCTRVDDASVTCSAKDASYSGLKVLVDVDSSAGDCGNAADGEMLSPVSKVGERGKKSRGRSLEARLCLRWSARDSLSELQPTLTRRAHPHTSLESTISG